MPSRVFAAPPCQVDKLTALPAQYDKDNFALPILEEVNHKAKYALDFQGRKHLDREVSIDSFQFGPRVDASTSYSEFQMPGLASANALRDFLRQHMEPDQVVNEYGDECDLSDISNDHLPDLQTKVWAKVSNSRSPTKTTPQQPSRAQVLIAEHIEKISQLLEEKHIFVFSEDTRTDTCNYLSDLQITPKRACHSQIVRIEPLVHWGTVTPASPSHYILPFRRDGELMKDPDTSGFKSLVRRIVDVDAPAYCADCLGYLWDKRTEAGETMRQLQHTIPRHQSRVLDNTSPLLPVLKLKKSGSALRNAGTLAIGGTLGATACYSKPAEGDLQKHVGEALPQLDGTSDSRSEALSLRSSGNGEGNNAIWISSDSDGPIENHTVRAIPLQQTDSLTLPLRPTLLTPKSSFEISTSCAPPSKPPSLVTSKVSSILKENLLARVTAIKDNCGSQVIDLTIPPRANKHRFGRELDINTKALPVQVRKSPRKHKNDILMSQENRPPPVKPMKPLKPVQKTVAAIKETQKRKAASSSEQIDKQKKARTIALKNLNPPTRIATKSAEPVPSKSIPWINSPTELQDVPKPEPTVQFSSPPMLIVHFAKRPTNIEVPDGVATLEWEAFQELKPDATCKICWCNKPAGHGTFKKNELSHIGECIRKDCRFRWFHYACLNQSEKGKARFGTLLCSICRTEQDLAEQDQKNKWSVEKLMDFKEEWTKRDIEAQMPGLGGVISQANPYGLGTETQLRPMYETRVKETGTLGELEKLGYVQSRPEMLEEAYCHAGAYAELMNRWAEEEGGEWVYEGHDHEEDMEDEL